MVEFDEQEQIQCNQINTMLQSAGNPMFSSELRYQTLIILDLGTPNVDIIKNGHVGGLSNVFQSADANKPALLSVSNYLDAWPNYVIVMDATKATIYESPCQNK